MYAKVFTQIYDGTLCTKGPWEALVTFQQLLVLADLEGNVDMTAQAISRRTTIPLNIITKGISALLQPDPESRTPEEEGRRILPLSDQRNWGWRVVNYKHYKSLRKEEDRREYHRNYWHIRKEKGSIVETQQNSTHSTHTEAEAYTKAVVKPLSGKPDLPPGFVKFWTAWPRSERKQGKPKCFGIWKQKGLERFTDEIVGHVEHMAQSESWRTGYDPMPETYLRGMRWDGAEHVRSGPDYARSIADLPGD